MEIWKDIDGYEGQYQVSSFGRVKSLDRVVDRKKNGTGNLPLRGIEITQRISYGYCRITLRNKLKVRTTHVHRLVAETFVDNPDNKTYINHKDGNKQNNKVENLEWVTSKENNVHAFANNLRNTKLSVEKVKQIKKDWTLFIQATATRHSVERSTIKMIINNEIWTNV